MEAPLQSVPAPVPESLNRVASIGACIDPLRVSHLSRQCESRQEPLQATLTSRRVSRPVDHERDRPIARLYDYDLIARNEEAIVPQLRDAIEHERRELMQFNVPRCLRAERQPQMDASIREILRDAFSNEAI